jgi:hypothetical protein
MSSPLYTCWADANDWRPGFVILGANVNSILTPPPHSLVITGADGFWGAHEWTVYLQPHRREFLYLAWIPLRQPNTSDPSDIHTSIDKSMWRAQPGQPNVHVTSRPLLDRLTKKWESVKAALEDPFKKHSSDPSFLSVRHPKEAYIRAFSALSRMEKEFGAWRDFVEVFRNLQQSLLELVAFLDWWKDIRAGNKFQCSIRGPTRGAIFEDARLYENYACWSVGAFLLVHRSTFVLNHSKQVALSPRMLCKLQPMSVDPPLHSLDLWYYPPLVHDFVMELETAARGYVERLDTLNPTKVSKRKQDKMENRKAENGKPISYPS